MSFSPLLSMCRAPALEVCQGPEAAAERALRKKTTGRRSMLEHSESNWAFAPVVAPANVSLRFGGLPAKPSDEPGSRASAFCPRIMSNASKLVGSLVFFVTLISISTYLVPVLCHLAF